MGKEYKIRIANVPAGADRDLRAIRFFADVDEQHGLYNLRSTSTTGMPNAWVQIEPDGLYFCDNGGSVADSAMIFRSIIDLALRWSDKIELEEL